MSPLFCVKETILRAFERKWAIAVLLLLVFASTVCGIVLVRTPAFYEFHLRVCDRYLNRVCYSDTSVFLIFFERTAGGLSLLLLVMCGGLHPAALLLPTSALALRGYLFGGSLAILFTVYRAAGALVVFTVYLPVHLLLDALLLLAAANSFCRALRFRFCAWDFKELLLDAAVFAALVAVCFLLEAFLLGVLYHPIGDLL